MKRFLPPPVMALMLGGLIACDSSAPQAGTPTPPIAPGQVVTANATIEFLNLEGGCWAVRTSDGRRYEPVNLGQSFRVDHLAVLVVLRDAPDMVSLCMIGPLVTIDSITAP